MLYYIWNHNNGLSIGHILCVAIYLECGFITNTSLNVKCGLNNLLLFYLHDILYLTPEATVVIFCSLRNLAGWFSERHVFVIMALQSPRKAIEVSWRGDPEGKWSRFSTCHLISDAGQYLFKM